MTKRALFADGLMILIAVIWGGAFAVVKNTLDSFPPAALIAMRYVIAAGLTAVVFRKHLVYLTRTDFACGALVGAMLFAAYMVQTIGIQYTTAGKNAFLTTFYVLVVPFACAFLFGQKLRAANFAAAVLMLFGIGLLSLSSGDGGGLNAGDALTLLGGVFFAAHIVSVERCQPKTNTYALIVLQFAFTALYALIASLIFERGQTLTFTRGSVGGLLYIAVGSTAIGTGLQNIAQSMAPASHAAVLLSLESVFGVIFACLLLGEVLTPQMALGFAVIFAALIINALAPAQKA